MKSNLSLWLVAIYALIILVFLDVKIHSLQYGECPPTRDYQLEVTKDSIYIFDGTREVGQIGWGEDSLSNILSIDNQ